MSIIFEANKEKKLSMLVEVENVDNNDLTYTFNIKIDNVVYGFPCSIKENKIEITIPALDTVIKEVKSGTYDAYLDVIEENKFHSRPYEEQVKIEQQPKIDVLLNSDTDEKVKESVNVLVSKIIEENPKEEKKKKIKEEKKKESVLSKVFE